MIADSRRFKHGILSIKEAAAFLACKPVELMRVTSLGYLPENRGPDGYVYHREALDAYIGRGMPGLKPIDLGRGKLGAVGNIWPSVLQYKNAIKAAGEDAGLPDHEVEAALSKKPSARVLKFKAKPTPAMRERFNADLGSVKHPCGYSFGVGAMAMVVQETALRAGPIKITRSKYGRYERIYESKAALEKTQRESLAGLNRLTIEYRSEYATKTYRTVNIVRSLWVGELSEDFTRDIMKVHELVF